MPTKTKAANNQRAFKQNFKRLPHRRSETRHWPLLANRVAEGMRERTPVKLSARKHHFSPHVRR